MQERWRRWIILGLLFGIIAFSLYFAQHNFNELVVTLFTAIVLILIIRVLPDVQWVVSTFTLIVVAALTEHGQDLGLRLPKDMPAHSRSSQRYYNSSIPGGWLSFVQIDQYGDGELFQLALMPIPNTSPDPYELAKKYDPILAWFDPNIETRSNPQMRELYEFFDWKKMSPDQQTEAFKNSVFEMIKGLPQQEAQKMMAKSGS